MLTDCMISMSLLDTEARLHVCFVSSSYFVIKLFYIKMNVFFHILMPHLSKKSTSMSYM